MKSNFENIIECYEQADAIDRREGLQAYPRYHEVCQRIAKDYGYSLEKVIAVFAATSPNNDYKGNLRSTISILDGHRAGRGFDEIQISTYRHCGERAFSYLTGTDFLGTVKGKKIRSFYMNILQPENPEFITIDGHAVNIWFGEQIALKQVAVNKKWKYETIANDYKRLAKLLNILPCQLQAITWFSWKRIHRIVFDAQTDLFSDFSDIWQIVGTYEKIEPFPPIKK